MKIRKATVLDVKAIQGLINSYAKEGKMLSRSLSELFENVRDFSVAEKEGEIIGCCALHSVWEDLAEVKSLAVVRNQRGQGIGRRLLRAALKEAGSLGITRIFVLTYEPDFFKRQGFKVIDKSELPHKVWSECIKCVYFPDCNEVPLILEVR
ncbi:N-acetyltransferase [bacterium]|nr:N-acetyltransferase [bacterium]